MTENGVRTAMTRYGGVIRPARVAACSFFVLVGVNAARADDVSVAVATNFVATMTALQKPFEAETGHTLTITTGATGKLYAQIRNGAPFDVLLSADSATPERLETEGHAVPGTRRTYAIGRLVLWSRDATRISGDGARDLAAGGFRHLAIANPDIAPYGAAARETLRALRLWDDVQSKIVIGQNIGQAHALVATGNAELGFVALSAISDMPADQRGSTWIVPSNFYAPIRQDAALLKRGADNTGAKAFLAFLRQAPATRIIERYGYALE